jgi:hypothetical protein
MLKIMMMANNKCLTRERLGRHLKRKTATLRSVLALVLLATLAVPSTASATDLQPAATAAFDRYCQLTQAQFESQNLARNPFLWIDTLPSLRREAVYEQLKSGQVVIERLETQDAGKAISAPGAMIHHWIGTAFIPSVTLAQVISFEQDYDHQAPDFQPDVVRSKILVRTGPDFKINIRFYKKKVISVVLDTDHTVHYGTIDATYAWSESRTTRIQQVSHPGEAGEILAPEGHDDGFLWKMNTYWRFEERDGGVYIESQSVSLTRDIPTGLGWMVGPFVTSIPRESLDFILAQTRKAVLQRAAQAAGAKLGK